MKAARTMQKATDNKGVKVQEKTDATPSSESGRGW